MNRVDSQAMPAPPSLMKSLKAGFDAVSNHFLLIFFPVMLDLLLWLGPHFSLRQLVLAMLAKAEETADMPEFARSVQEMWLLVVERFNLVSALRTFPVGVSSLMASRSPVDIPAGQPFVWEVTSIATGMGIWALLTLAGLVLGTLYFLGVSQAAVWGSIHWLDNLKRWPRASVQSVGLALLWVAVLMIVSMPFVCAAPFMVILGSVALPAFLLAYLFLLAWVLFPLIFSPHGLFLYGMGVFRSLQRGIYLVRRTLPSTFVLVAIAVVVSEGLNVLWNVPPDHSWMMLVGIAGHAFVTTGLLAASFVYYRDADRWVHEQANQAKA